MNKAQLLRYSRQMMLDGIGLEGQTRLLDSRVLVIGLGGLGSPVAQYLAAAGVGTLWLADGDRVELSNLQRQVIHDQAHLGMDKAESAALRLKALNPDTQIEVLNIFADENNLPAWLAKIDVVVDCSDNFDTRYRVNAACWAAAKPLISAAAIRFEGHLYAFDPRIEGSPCYACLYPPQLGDSAGETCAQSGILGPLVGAIGSLQALETIKIITSIGTPLVGQMLIVDGLHQEWRRLTLAKDPHCVVCNGVR